MLFIVGRKTQTLLNVAEGKNSQTLHFLSFIILNNRKYGVLFILDILFQSFIWMYLAHFQDFSIYIEAKVHYYYVAFHT